MGFVIATGDSGVIAVTATIIITNSSVMAVGFIIREVTVWSVGPSVVFVVVIVITIRLVIVEGLNVVCDLANHGRFVGRS